MVDKMLQSKQKKIDKVMGEQTKTETASADAGSGDASVSAAAVFAQLFAAPTGGRQQLLPKMLQKLPVERPEEPSPQKASSMMADESDVFVGDSPFGSPVSPVGCPPVGGSPVGGSPVGGSPVSDLSADLADLSLTQVTEPSDSPTLKYSTVDVGVEGSC